MAIDTSFKFSFFHKYKRQETFFLQGSETGDVDEDERLDFEEEIGWDLG